MKGETDITEKIRSAIKAKLGQIGAYVDDELPDYIMVMVANKKTIAQITEDLSLFLGSKTERFTDWLDRLLKKLQAVDGETDKSLKEEKKVERKKRKGDNEKSAASKEKSKAASAKSEAEKTPNKNEAKKRESRKRRSDEISKPAEDKEIATGASSPKPSTSYELLEDAIVVQQQDNGEFEEVVKGSKTPKKDDGKAEVRVANDRKLIKTSTGENVPARKVREELLRERRRRTSETNLRQSMTSVVASVRLQASDSESEGEELKSGSTVNVVRHGRRSAVRGRGEEKLLVRACREATSSIGERPFHRQNERDYRYHGGDRQFVGQRGVHDRPSRHPRDHAYRDHRGYEPCTLWEGGKMSGVCLVATATQTSPVSDKIKLVGDQNHSDSKEKPVENFPSTKLEKETEGRKDSARLEMEQTPQTTAAPPVVRSIYDYDERKTLEYAQQQRKLPPKRLCDEFRAPSGVRVTEPYSPSRPFVVSRDPPQSDSDASVEEVTDSRKVQCDQVYDKYRLNKNDRISPMDHIEQRVHVYESSKGEPDPKFIVTLDGGPLVVSRTVAIPLSDLDDSYVRAVDSPPMTSTPLDSKRKKWCVDKDEIEDGGTLVVEPMDVDDKIGRSLDDLLPEKQKNIRCKFWPTCKNGTNCLYVHPSVQCHMFPNCSFGSRCLYIHPNCRYDAICVNSDCPYMHSSRRDPLTLVAAKIINFIPHHQPQFVGPRSRLCRFANNCINTACPYVHPTECRYGAECRNRNDGCQFRHPPVPTPGRFKWCNSDKFVISSQESIL